jgi:hypothetical protein
MNVLTAFWLAASAAISISVLTVFLLRRSLDALLLELCGSAGRARFWSVFSSVAIVLTALLGMLASFPLSESSDWASYPQLPFALAAVRLSLLCLLLALGALGFVLLLGIGMYEHRRRQDLHGDLPPIVPGTTPTTPRA